MRQVNLSSILHHLREHAPVSRTALAKITGLDKATVSRLVENLIRLELIRETGKSVSGGRGRRAVLLEINPRGGFIISAEIGVGFILVTCADFSSRIFWRRHEDTAQLGSRDAILQRTLSLVRSAMRFGNARFSKILGLALGVPGLVDSSEGTLLFAPNLGWSEVPLGRILREQFPVRIFVENEARLAALGEWYSGVARGFQQVLYISAGVGVGGGLVSHGRVVNGVSGFAGEFGHVTMDPDGIRCGCGNRGCWETQASQMALFRSIREAISSGTPSVLQAMTGNDLNALSVPLVVEAAKADDQVALASLRSVGRALGIGIASLINCFNPDLVVIGGTLSAAGRFILPTLKQEVHHRVLPWAGDVANVVWARNGSDNCVLGGVAKVCEWIISQPTQPLPECTMA